MENPAYDPPKGVWYEKARDRWRVKVIRDRVTVHQSYHKDYQVALSTWLQVQREIKTTIIPVPRASLINKFLCQPLVRG